MTDELDNFIKNNQKYVSLLDGDSYTGIYQGFVMGINSFGNESVFYRFKSVGGDKIVTWQSAQPAVAMKMKNFKVGDCLKITRQGSKENPPTKYTIETVTPF